MYHIQSSSKLIVYGGVIMKANRQCTMESLVVVESIMYCIQSSGKTIVYGGEAMKANRQCTIESLVAEIIVTLEHSSQANRSFMVQRFATEPMMSKGN